MNAPEITISLGITIDEFTKELSQLLDSILKFAKKYEMSFVKFDFQRNASI